MNPAISVLLPTIRPSLALKAMTSLVHAARSVSYEVVVVSDFTERALGCCAPTAHLHAVWIERERRGVIDAVNVACQAARGDFWFLFNDESVLEPGALETLYYEALRTPDAVLSPLHLPAFPFVYYGRTFLPFPFAHRRVIEGLGGLLDPVYKGFYADPDFSLRAMAAGVPMRVVTEAVLRHRNEHDAPHMQSVGKYLDADRATFRARWDHLGEFADP